MHRTKTRFAARINHVASALEKRGVRATYTLHDRVLSNRSSRRHFSGSQPALDDVERHIVSAWKPGAADHESRQLLAEYRQDVLTAQQPLWRDAAELEPM